MTTPEARKRETAPPSLLVVTDLDATLLDEQTYDWTPAAEAINTLAARNVPLVLCSSKTRAEMRPLATELGVTAPIIVENGGAIVGRRDDHLAWPAEARTSGEEVELVLGASRDVLAPALISLAAEAGVDVEPLASMTVERVSELTGLPRDRASLARQREYSEPFVSRSPVDVIERLGALARTRGLRVTRGGRFWHLIGPSDKGRAVAELTGLYARSGERDITVVALGDAPNDLEMLAAAAVAIVVPRAQGPDPGLLGALPGARIAPHPGPRGWNAAILHLIREQEGKD